MLFFNVVVLYYNNFTAPEVQKGRAARSRGVRSFEKLMYTGGNEGGGGCCMGTP